MAQTPNNASNGFLQSESVVDATWHIYAALRRYENEHAAPLPRSFVRARRAAYRKFVEVSK